MIFAQLADKQVLRQLAAELEKAPRQGAAVDRPEGERFIVVSDTLAKEIVATLRRIAGEPVESQGHREKCPSLRLINRGACDCRGPAPLPAPAGANTGG